MPKKNDRDSTTGNGPDQAGAQARKRRRKRHRRLMIWISAVLFFFLVVIPALVNIYADRIFGETVREIIRVETSGKYGFSYDDISFNLFNRDLVIDSLLIFPDSAYAAPDSVAGGLPDRHFELEIPKLQLKGASIINVLLRRQLEIKTIFVGEPTFVLVINEAAADSLQPADTLPSGQFDYRQLHNIMSDYLSLLQIDDFELDRGNFRVRRQQPGTDETFEVRNFSIVFSDFYLDSAAYRRRDRLFYSDSLGFTMNNGYFRFKSNLHEVALKDIEVSSVGQSIVIENLEITSDTSRLDRNSEGWLDLKIPVVKLTGLDFNKTLSQQVQLDEMLIRDAQIIYHPPLQAGALKFDRREIARRVFDEISAYFEPVTIARVRLENAGFRIAGFHSTSLRDFYMPHIDLSLYEVNIDSATFDQKSPWFFVQDIRLEVRDQQFVLTRAGTKIAFDSLLLDSRYSVLDVTHLKILPDPEATQKGGLTIDLPYVTFKGEDFKKDFIDRALTLDTLRFDSPRIRIAQKHQRDTAATFRMHHLYEYIDDYLSWLRVDKLLVDKGQLTYDHGPGPAGNLHVDPFSVELSGFILDQNSSYRDKVLYAQDVSAQMHNLTYFSSDNAQKIGIGKLGLSTRDGYFKIDDLYIDTLQTGDRKTGRTLISLAQVMATDFDFNKLYQHKKVDIGNLRLSDGTAKYFMPETGEISKTSLVLPDIHIGNFQLDSSSLFIYQNPDSLSFMQVADAFLNFKNLHTNPGPGQRPVLADSIRSALSNVVIRLSGDRQALHMDHIRYQTADSLLQVRGIRFMLHDTLSSGRLPLRAFTADNFSLAQFRAQQFYENDQLMAGRLLLENPVVKFEGRTGSVDTTGFLPVDGNRLRKMLLKIAGLIDIEKIDITGGTVEMDQDGRQDRRRLLVRGGHLQADDFYVEENNPMDSTHLLFTGDIKLFVRELLQPADEKQGGFSMKSLDISTREGLLSADSLELNDRPPLDQLSDSSGVGIFVKNIRLDGLDYYRLLTAKTFEVKQVRVEQPLVLLKREISLQNRKPETAGRINLYRMLRGRLRKIAARDVDISDARLKLINLLGDHSDTYLFDRIDFDIRNVLIDSTNRVFSNKFLYSDDLNFSIRDYRHTSSDSLYDYGAAWVSFRSADMNLEVDSGFLTPRLDEMAFAKKVGTQTDRLNLAFDRMVLSRCRVVEFLTDNRLWIDKLVIDSLSGGDYRDKSYPLPEGHFPPLPATALRRLDFLLRVDTLKIHNSNFTYREYVKPALKPGRMWFTNVELTGRNITNSPERIAHDSLMQFSATGKLMGKGRLDLYLRFRLGSGSDVFRAKGFINQMELTALNPFLEHTAFVKVKKGYNNKIEFAFTADDSLSRGLMDFEYQKLKIRLIDKKNLRDKGLGESIASFIANTFVVRKNNPKLIFFERTGDIYFQRNKEKSFFNYLAKSVLSGVQSTIRGGNEERKELRTKHKLERQLRREGKLDAYFHEK